MKTKTGTQRQKVSLGKRKVKPLRLKSHVKAGAACAYCCDCYCCYCCCY